MLFIIYYKIENLISIFINSVFLIIFLNKLYKYFTSNDIIGRGAFVYVYKSKDSKTNEEVAIKEIYFKDDDEKYDILNELI